MVVLIRGSEIWGSPYNIEFIFVTSDNLNFGSLRFGNLSAHETMRAEKCTLIFKLVVQNILRHCLRALLSWVPTLFSGTHSFGCQETGQSVL